MCFDGMLTAHAAASGAPTLIDLSRAASCAGEILNFRDENAASVKGRTQVRPCSPASSGGAGASSLQLLQRAAGLVPAWLALREGSMVRAVPQSGTSSWAATDLCHLMRIMA